MLAAILHDTRRQKIDVKTYFSKCETYMKIIKLFGVIPMYNGLTYFPKENDSLDVQTFTTMLFLFLSSLWESSCLCQLLLMFVLLVY